MLSFGDGHLRAGRSGPLTRTRASWLWTFKLGQGLDGINTINIDSDGQGPIQGLYPGPPWCDTPSQYTFKSVGHQSMVSARPCLSDIRTDKQQVSLRRTVLGNHLRLGNQWGSGGLMRRCQSRLLHLSSESTFKLIHHQRVDVGANAHHHVQPIQSATEARSRRLAPGSATPLTAQPCMGR